MSAAGLFSARGSRPDWNNFPLSVLSNKTYGLIKNKSKTKKVLNKNVEAQRIKISRSSCDVLSVSVTEPKSWTTFSSFQETAALMWSRSFHSLLTNPEPAMNSSREQTSELWMERKPNLKDILKWSVKLNEWIWKTHFIHLYSVPPALFRLFKKTIILIWLHEEKFRPVVRYTWLIPQEMEFLSCSQTA